jgi:Transglycosylase-like domain
MYAPKRALLAVTLATAGIIPATSAAEAGAAPQQSQCGRLFTLAMFAKAADTVYAGTDLPPPGSYGHLWLYAKCQRPPSSEATARRLWAKRYQAWADRRNPTTSTAAAASPPAVAAPSGLVACIISHESGGNPQATNGLYSGIAQWSPTAWAQDGGLRYASSPLGASYGEQLAVLEGEGTAGMISQQGVFDGCA